MPRVGTEDVSLADYKKAVDMPSKQQMTEEDIAWRNEILDKAKQNNLALIAAYKEWLMWNGEESSVEGPSAEDPTVMTSVSMDIASERREFIKNSAMIGAGLVLFKSSEILAKEEIKMNNYIKTKLSELNNKIIETDMKINSAIFGDKKFVNESYAFDIPLEENYFINPESMTFEDGILTNKVNKTSQTEKITLDVKNITSLKKFHTTHKIYHNHSDNTPYAQAQHL
jgi:hypothetical protein